MLKFKEDYMPKGFKKFAWKNARTGICYFKKISNNKYIGICTECGEKFESTMIKHHTEVSCPHCQSQITTHNMTFLISDIFRTPVAFAQRSSDGKGIVIRRFEACRNYRKFTVNDLMGESDVELNENFAEFEEKERYYFEDGGKCYREKFESFYSFSDHCCNPSEWHTLKTFGVSADFWFYVDNFQSVIKGKPISRLPYELFKSYNSDIVIKMKELTHTPQYEMLYKSGFKVLIEDILRQKCRYQSTRQGIDNKTINLRGKSYQGVLGLTKSQVKAIGVNNLKLSTFSYVKQAIKDNVPLQLIKTALLVGDRRLAVTYDCYEILKDRFPNISVKDVLKWQIKQQYSVIAYSLKDYYNQCEQLSIPLDKIENILPRNFDEVHNSFSRKIRYATSQKNEVAYQKHKMIWDFLQVVSNEYEIQLPKNLTEIIREGEMIGHCVGGYTNRVADGTSIILFARKTMDPTTPLATIEINPKTKKVVQYHGNGVGTGNAQIDERLKDFLFSWAERNKLKIA